MNSLPKIKISLSTPICLAAFTLIYGIKYISAILAAVLFHELGHIAFIYLFRGNIAEITLRPFGAVIKRADTKTSYFADAVISLAGRLVNIFSFLICLFASTLGSFAYASLVLAVVNLIPARPLDGYCALRSILLCLFSPQTAKIVGRCISLAILIVIWIFTVYMMIFAEFNLSLLIMITLFIYETVISCK